jgi:hypothetical protein
MKRVSCELSPLSRLIVTSFFPDAPNNPCVKSRTMKSPTSLALLTNVRISIVWVLTTVAPAALTGSAGPPPSGSSRMSPAALRLITQESLTSVPRIVSTPGRTGRCRPA